ncbi:cupin domain-containing protein [Caenispirillum bisanense]|uniref:cupin domain-containing protein n=1 Tax=Caenispirillum bisanense TaxID=414052 RepID=UPI0031DA2E53
MCAADNDPVAGKATPVQHLENGRTRVTEWRFAPGDETGFHTHEYDYVIVPVTASRMRLEHPDGSVTYADLEPGRSYFRPAGTAHNVVNEGIGDLIFVEVEFLEPAAAAGA